MASSIPSAGDQHQEAKAALLLRLRAGGIANLDVLRAMEAVPRAAFLPPRHIGRAARDIALPLDGGQTQPAPSFIARALEALACGADHHVLEIGSGSGFVTALLARLAADVLGCERDRSLAAAAQARLTALGIANAMVVYRDGLAPLGVPDLFDRILLLAAVREPPAALLDRLAPGGVLLYPLIIDVGRGARRQTLMRLNQDADGTPHQQPVCPARLQEAQTGRSAA